MDWIEIDLQKSNNSWANTHKNIESVIRNNIDNILTGVEIGVAYGSNSYNLLDKFTNLTLYSIDPYIEYSEIDKMSDNTKGERGDQLFKFTSERLKNSFGERSIFLRETSDTASSKFENLSLDFCFIDGDHSYEAVKKDIYNMYNKIKIGGILCGDDYNFLNKASFEVKRAVDEFCTNFNLNLNITDAVWWIKIEKELHI